MWLPRPLWLVVRYAKLTAWISLALVLLGVLPLRAVVAFVAVFLAALATVL